jgi:hypothetical protein
LLIKMRAMLQIYALGLASVAVGVQAMLSKRASYLQKQGDIEPEKRFKANVADLFLTNEISGCRTRQLLQDHVDADKHNVEDLLKAGASGKYPNNVARDLIRKLKKRTAWPPLYWAKIKVFDLQMQVTRRKWMPFILPHELVWSLLQHATDENNLFQHTGLCQQSLDHLNKCATSMGTSMEHLVPLSIWGDGVPMNFDRTQSLEVFSLSLPGLNGTQNNLRFPITVVPKKYVAKGHTKDDIYAVIAWSFQQLAAGRFPSERHDGEKWLASDVWRKNKVLKPLPKGILVEVKGDWAFMKDAFRFPQHNENMGCCWLCAVCPQGIRNASSSAPWRTQRLTHWELLHRIQSQGHSISPIFGVPFLTSHQFLIDWLHVADQGISATFLASLFLFVLPKLPGHSKEAQVAHLYGLMFDFYENNNVDSKLDNLTLKMLGKTSKPKLRAKAAEVRALIDFGVLLAQQTLNAADPLEQSVILAAKYLQECYSNLSQTLYNRQALSTSCRLFCSLMCELEARIPMFKIIPKQHLFQELCEVSAINPSLTWCYRDEEFGGSLAGISKVRGGSNRATNIAKAVLIKFCAQHRLPRI